MVHQLQIPWLDGNSLGMNCTKVHVLHEPDQPSLHGLLDGQQCYCLEMKVHSEVLCDLPDQSGHTQFPAQQFSAFLVPSYLAKCHCAWVIPARFLYSPYKCQLLKWFGRYPLLGSLPGTFLVLLQLGVTPGPFPIIFIIIITRRWSFLGSLC